jgi:hypothetical protein
MPKKPEPTFDSTFKKIGEVTLPLYEGKRIMMMPIIIGDDTSIPDVIGEWKATLTIIAGMADPLIQGKVGYLTLDEKVVTPGATHRRSGKHVDGMAKGVTPSLVDAIKKAKPNRLSSPFRMGVVGALLSTA